MSGKISQKENDLLKEIIKMAFYEGRMSAFEFGHIPNGTTGALEIADEFVEKKAQWLIDLWKNKYE